LALGQAIVRELKLDPGVDTLSRWMAHYIAELIKNLETAKVKDRYNEYSKCADAILKVWERRYILPDGKRPFEEWEPIFETLESLNPDEKKQRYYRPVRIAAERTKQDSKTRRWLDLAKGLDYSAKILIRYCLVQAAQTTSTKTKKWINLVEASEDENFDELPIIRGITEENDLLNATKIDDQKRKLLEDRINKLNGFITMSVGLMHEMKEQLKKYHPQNRNTNK
jgi:hypothetical protein